MTIAHLGLTVKVKGQVKGQNAVGGTPSDGNSIYKCNLRKQQQHF